MLYKVLISCALFVAAQANYASSGYGGQKSSIAGFAAQFQPAVTLTVLPSSAGGYGSASAYGAAPAYGAHKGASSYGSVVIPVSGGYASGAGGVDAEALRLAKLVFALPSAGGPNEAILNIPQYSTTSYSAPAVVLASGDYGSNAVSGASAAAAAANVKSASSGYGPAPAPASSAGSGYGPAPAASY
ncbi:chorion protein S18 [Lucilia cuprina]|uniref:chorion protein S18 n=1 Tax=Lucilia cuprina TaxID=7375 RepID=UPI001F0529AF|nr:chorion protein S18 [Lucilia cuprina]